MTSKSKSLAEIRDELRARYVARIDANPEEVATGVETLIDHEKAFVVDAESSRSVVITGPARSIARAELTVPDKLFAPEQAAYRHPGFEYIQGRFVEADHANRNGAYWSTADLELGEPSVAGGPLNWLHEDDHIIGSILAAELVRTSKQAAAAETIGNHIVATAGVWKFLYPNEAYTIAKASDSRELWYSMECVSRAVECLDSPGRPGCGETFEYATYMHERDKTCAHLASGSSMRRLVDPLFLGGAVIIPPTRPGWANADARLMKDAAKVAEAAGLHDDNMVKAEAEAMVAQILRYAASLH